MTAGTLVNLVAPVRVVGLSVLAVSAGVCTLGALRRSGVPLVELLVGAAAAVAGAALPTAAVLWSAGAGLLLLAALAPARAGRRC